MAITDEVGLLPRTEKLFLPIMHYSNNQYLIPPMFIYADLIQHKNFSAL